MSTAAAQLRRILQLIPHLADGQEHTFAELAARVGTDETTVRHDVRSMSERVGDEPGGFVEEVRVFIGTDSVALSSNHFLRPMRLTSAELQALELGLAMLRTERPPDEHAVIDRARSRLRETLSKLPAEPIPELRSHAAIGSAGSTEHLAAIRASLRGRRKLRISYRRAGGDAATERSICPYALAAASGMLYVIAYCEGSDGIRVFRLDRIEAAKATAERYEIPETFSLDDILRDGKVFKADSARTLRVRYSPRVARWIAEREGLACDDDGSLTTEHPLADPQWAVRHVLQYGPDAEILSPLEVREEVARRLDAALAATSAPRA